MRPEFAPPAEKKCIENREETHQCLYVVNHLKKDDNYVVRQLKQPRAENCSEFLLLQVLYCNLEMQDCQGPLKIKINTQNLIRSKRKSEVRLNLRFWSQGAPLNLRFSFLTFSYYYVIGTSEFLRAKFRDICRSSRPKQAKISAFAMHSSQARRRIRRWIFRPPYKEMINMWLRILTKDQEYAIIRSRYVRRRPTPVRGCGKILTLLYEA